MYTHPHTHLLYKGLQHFRVLPVSNVVSNHGLAERWILQEKLSQLLRRRWGGEDALLHKERYTMARLLVELFCSCQDQLMCEGVCVWCVCGVCVCVCVVCVSMREKAVSLLKMTHHSRFT